MRIQASAPYRSLGPWGRGRCRPQGPAASDRQASAGPWLTDSVGCSDRMATRGQHPPRIGEAFLRGHAQTSISTSRHPDHTTSSSRQVGGAGPCLPHIRLFRSHLKSLQAVPGPGGTGCGGELQFRLRSTHSTVWAGTDLGCAGCPPRARGLSLPGRLTKYIQAARSPRTRKSRCQGCGPRALTGPDAPSHHGAGTLH